jgi:hypothetical protein
MRKLSSKDTAEVRNRFIEHEEAYRETKFDLIKAAREAEDEDRFPEYLWPDVTDDAWFHRKSAASEIIAKRGGFSSNVATLALTDSAWETKEAVASWLRRELKALREAEGKSGAAPVRRRAALSRSVVSDIAIELLGVYRRRVLDLSLSGVAGCRSSPEVPFRELHPVGSCGGGICSARTPGPAYWRSYVCQTHGGRAQLGFPLAEESRFSRKGRVS